ncbi:S8 family serine peptidase [Nannocystis pusilla]|uniref:S8 family serine peptidase n=1 Tax=Nannocystis pusilla TaxID=889268 RepID=UPI003B7AE864
MQGDEAAAFSAAARAHDRLPWPDAARITTVTGSTTPAAPVPVEPMPPAALLAEDEESARSGPTDAPGWLAAPEAEPEAVVGVYDWLQTYRGAAPLGMDFDRLRGQYWNAFGTGWGYTDVEYNWNRNHADLAAIAGNGVLVNGTPNLLWVGTPPDLQNVVDHGTGVIGILSSTADGIGTTGLVPHAAVRLSTESTAQSYNRVGAISTAAAQFWPGGVILLEMQTLAGFDCNFDGVADDGDLVPAEWDPAVKDVVRTAVANGRVVIAAAGNGSGCDLGHFGFNNAFSTTDPAQDSGAILVGAGVPGSRSPESFSTVGRASMSRARARRSSPRAAAAGCTTATATTASTPTGSTARRARRRWSPASQWRSRGCCTSSSARSSRLASCATCCAATARRRARGAYRPAAGSAPADLAPHRAPRADARHRLRRRRQGRLRGVAAGQRDLVHPVLGDRSDCVVRVGPAG